MMNKVVFVFGSNLAGRHGKGAAKVAKEKWGAVYGVGVGRQDNAYAIPTKGKNLEVLSLSEIGVYVEDFLRHVENNPDTLFYVTAFGTGLAGYSVEQIKGLFDASGLPYNIAFAKEWIA